MKSSKKISTTASRTTVQKTTRRKGTQKSGPSSEKPPSISVPDVPSQESKPSPSPTLNKLCSTQMQPWLDTNRHGHKKGNIHKRIGPDLFFYIEGENCASLRMKDQKIGLDSASLRELIETIEEGFGFMSASH